MTLVITASSLIQSLNDNKLENNIDSCIVLYKDTDTITFDIITKIQKVIQNIQYIKISNYDNHILSFFTGLLLSSIKDDNIIINTSVMDVTPEQIVKVLSEYQTFNSSFQRNIAVCGMSNVKKDIHKKKKNDSFNALSSSSTFSICLDSLSNNTDELDISLLDKDVVTPAVSKTELTGVKESEVSHDIDKQLKKIKKKKQLIKFEEEPEEASMVPLSSTISTNKKRSYKLASMKEASENEAKRNIKSKVPEDIPEMKATAVNKFKKFLISLGIESIVIKNNESIAKTYKSIQEAVKESSEEISFQVALRVKLCNILMSDEIYTILAPKYKELKNMI